MGHLNAKDKNASSKIFRSSGHVILRVFVNLFAIKRKLETDNIYTSFNRLNKIDSMLV